MSHDMARIVTPTDEQVAFAVGAQLARTKVGLVRFLVTPDYQIRTRTSVRASEALYRMGHDKWAQWVRKGYEEGKRR